MNQPSKVIFMNDELENAFNSLSDKDPIKKALINAIRNIKEDYRAGEYIPKSKVPIAYLNKYKIDNIRVYDLPSAWRLMYTITGNSEIEIVSILLDWMDHKDYMKLFHD